MTVCHLRFSFIMNAGVGDTVLIQLIVTYLSDLMQSQVLLQHPEQPQPQRLCAFGRGGERHSQQEVFYPQVLPAGPLGSGVCVSSPKQVERCREIHP